MKAHSPANTSVVHLIKKANGAHRMFCCGHEIKSWFPPLTIGGISLDPSTQVKYTAVPAHATCPDCKKQWVQNENI